jgi:hypothetical protein
MNAGLEESNQYLGDGKSLWQRYEDDGYLFFRNVIDREKIREVRSDIISVLHDYGLIPEDQKDAPVWTGKEVPDFLEIHTKIHALKSYDEMRTNPALVGIMERLFGAPVYSWMNVDVRTQTPRMVPITSIHQDYQVFYRAARFAISWIPLMDIEENVGGVDIAPGSHKSVTEADYGWSKERYYTGNAGCVLPALTEERCGRFARTTYNAGDLLVMHDKVAHRSLANTSKRLRLSMDVRFQPRDSFIPWYAKITASDLERYNRELNEEFIAVGATQEQMQRTLWRLFWYEGGEITPERITLEMQKRYPIPFGTADSM